MNSPTAHGLMRSLAALLGLMMLAACTYTFDRWTLEIRELQDDHAA